MFKEFVDIDCLVDTKQKWIYIENDLSTLSPNVDVDIKSVIGNYYRLTYHDDSNRDMEKVKMRIYKDDRDDIVSICINGSVYIIEHFSVYPKNDINDYKIVNTVVRGNIKYVRFTSHDYPVTIVDRSCV